VTTFPVSPPTVGWPSSPPTIRLAASLVAYVVASLLTTRTPDDVLQVWDDRLAGKDVEATASHANG
jgi:hypothetical protein